VTPPVSGVRLPWTVGDALSLSRRRPPFAGTRASRVNLVDVAVLVVVAVAAIQGLRLGAVLQVLTFGGFLLGLYLGALLASVTTGWVHSSSARTVVALTTMLGMAVLLGGVGRIAGARIFRRVHRGRLGAVDSGLGVVVAVLASLLALWLIANTLVNSSSEALNSSISHSTIIRSLDSVLPATPSVFSRMQNFLSAEGFPPVFAQLAPASAGPVTPAADSQVRSAVAAAGPSTVKIEGTGCGDIQEGSGFVVAPGLVVTNAHVVAGISHPTVDDATGVHATQVVLFDPSFDLAVLRVQGLRERPLTLDPQDVGRGTPATVLGFPGGGPFTAASAGVMAQFTAVGRDIYGQGLTSRDVYEIQAVVRPGNSGGPLVEPDGSVIGVVFSRSTTNGDIGYALTSPGVRSRVVRAESLSSSVGTGGCVAG
jgi:S1-C subfamily serine protease